MGSYVILLYCARTDDPADDFRSKMVETYVLARLRALLEHHNSVVRRTSINAITTLAKSGKLIYHFVVCED